MFGYNHDIPQIPIFTLNYLISVLVLVTEIKNAWYITGSFYYDETY